jgi:cyanate permease
MINSYIGLNLEKFFCEFSHFHQKPVKLDTGDDVLMGNFNSKKFVAYFLSLLVVAGLLGIALFTQTFGWPMAAFMSIGIIGIIALVLGYILTQRKLDTVKTFITSYLSKENIENVETDKTDVE